MLLVALFTVARSGLAGSGNSEPKIPPIAAPPTAPIPERDNLYTDLPPGCSLLSEPTVQALSPGATGQQTELDSDYGDFKILQHGCRWSAVSGDYVRFIRVDIHSVTDDLETVTGTFQHKVAGLADSTNIVQVEGQRPEPGLGDEAHIIYGIDTEGCRTARMLIRIKNADIDVTYGGCDRPPGEFTLATEPISETYMMNGIHTMAQDAVQNLTKF